MFIWVLLGLTLIIGYFTSAHFVGMLFKWIGSAAFGLFIATAIQNSYEAAFGFFVLAIILWSIGGKITNEYPKRGSQEELLK